MNKKNSFVTTKTDIFGIEQDPIRSGPCVNPAVQPPSYCCSHSVVSSGDR